MTSGGLLGVWGKWMKHAKYIQEADTEKKLIGIEIAFKQDMTLSCNDLGSLCRAAEDRRYSLRNNEETLKLKQILFFRTKAEMDAYHDMSRKLEGWTEAEIDHFFLDRFDCSQQKYQMAKAIADLQEPILKVGNEPGTYSLYIGIPFCPSRCSYCSFVSCNLDRDRKMVQPYVDCLCREVEEIRIQADKAGLKLCSIRAGFSRG